MSEKIFKGFKQVLRAEYESAVTGGTALGYIWFVRPDSGNTSEGDIYLGTRHYGHFGENDLADLTSKVTNICNSVGLVADGTFEGFTTDFIDGASSFANAIDKIATKVNELVATIDSKVASIAASDNSIGVDSLDPKNPKIKVKVSADSANTLTVKEDGLFVNVPEEVPYSGKESVKVSDKEISLQIDATDKVLSQSTSGLLATISLVQDRENSLHYTLTGKGGANLGEINIPKDQFLKEASFVSAATESDKLIDDNVIVGDPYLKFVFQTDSVDKTVYVSVKQLVDVYRAGNGIEINDNTVSLKLDSSTEKYLTLGENGLKLSGVDAAIADALTGGTGELNLVSDVTKSGDTFTVEYSNSTNSQLKLDYASSMDDSLTTPKPIGGLAAGIKVSELKKKTISQILDDILFEEINPTIVAPSASLSLTGGFSNNGVYEVNANAPQEGNFSKSFSRGSIRVVGQSDKYRAGEETSSFIYVGNTGTTELPEKVVLGDTTYGYHVEYGAGDTALTSKGNTATKDANNSPITNPLTAGSVNSPAVKINGTYPYYSNGANASTSSKETSFPSTASTTTSKLKLVAWNTTLIGAKFASEADTQQRLIFEFPAKKNVTKVEFYNTVSNAWELYGSANYKIESISPKNIQELSVDYKQLTTTGSLSGALQLRFTVDNA